MTRHITAHKGGRTARAPGARLTPQEHDRLDAVLRHRGVKYIDWYVGHVEADYKEITGDDTMELKDAIKKSIAKNGGTCEFNWNAKAKAWCLSGVTADHLVWESDDYEAANKAAAENDAAEYLIEYNDL